MATLRYIIPNMTPCAYVVEVLNRIHAQGIMHPEVISRKTYLAIDVDYSGLGEEQAKQLDKELKNIFDPFKS